MFVNCFTIKRPHDNPHDIDVIYEKFGNNIPKYCIYDGCMTGCVYLCCVDVRVNVVEICAKYGYEWAEEKYFDKMEIPDKMYTSEYTIYPTYKTTGPRYVLSGPRGVLVNK